MSRSRLSLRGALVLATGMLTGCFWLSAQPPTPADVADRVRQRPVPYAALLAAARDPGPGYLILRETGLADLVLGTTLPQVKARYGAPARSRETSEGLWWEYDDTLPNPAAESPAEDSTAANGVLAPDGTPEEGANTTPRRGTHLRLLFARVSATPRPSASPRLEPKGAAVKPVAPVVESESLEPGGTEIILPSQVARPAVVPSVQPLPLSSPPGPKVAPPDARLVHIEAWAPSRHLTRSLIRPLDSVGRVSRKYGPAEQMVPWGEGGVTAWLYPAADVGFVVSPSREDSPGSVLAVLVGLGGQP